MTPVKRESLPNILQSMPVLGKMPKYCAHHSYAMTVVLLWCLFYRCVRHRLDRRVVLDPPTVSVSHSQPPRVVAVQKASCQSIYLLLYVSQNSAYTVLVCFKSCAWYLTISAGTTYTCMCNAGDLTYFAVYYRRELHHRPGADRRRVWQHLERHINEPRRQNQQLGALHPAVPH